MAFQKIGGRLVDVIFGYDFFISYTWADGSKYAHSLYEKLKAQGFTVFHDEEEYTRGDNWTLLGRRALKKTRQLTLVATPRVHQSAPVLKELTAFQSTGRRIIPIEIGDSLNPQKYPESPLLPFIPAEILRINQPLQQDGTIPNEAPAEVVRELRRGFQHVRQSQKRVRILIGVCTALLALLILATWTALLAKKKTNEVLETLSKADLSRSEDLFDRSDTSAGLVFLARAVTEYPRSRAAGDKLWFALTQRAWPYANTVPMPHGQAILSVAFSPDGKRIVTASNDNTACVWDALTGQRIGKPLLHKQTVFCATFSPDGSRVATGSRDGTARIWDASTSRPLSDWLKHGNVISCLAFSHTGRWLATGSQDRTASVWDGQTGQQIGKPLSHSGEVHTVIFHPRDENLLLTVSGKTAQVWNVSTLQKVELKHTSEVNSAAFSPDGEQVITASTDGVARIWKANEEDGPDKTLAHPEAVRDAVFSPSGKFIATMGLNHVWLWNPDGSKLFPRPLEQSQPLTCIKFSPDSQCILSGSDSGQAQLWAVQSGEAKGEPIRERSQIVSLDFAPDGKRAAVATSAGLARVWELPALCPVSNLLSHDGRIESLACNSDRKLLVTACSDNLARVWNLENGQLAVKPLPHDSGVLSVAFSPDNKYVVTGATDGKLRIWLGASGKVMGEPILQDSSVSRVAFSSSGRYFATANDTGEIRLWDISNRQQVGVSMHHQDRITSLAFSPDDRYLLTASLDQTAQLWSTKTQKASLSLPDEDQKEVECAVFNSHGNLIATTSRSGAVCIWDIATGQKRMKNVMPKPVTSCAFSPDGAFLVSCCQDGTAVIWDTRTGKAASGALQHSQEVVEAAFSPDGKRVATASSDGSAMLWEVPTGQPLSEPLKHNDAVQHVLFADGHTLITSSLDQTVRVWELRSPDNPTERLRIAQFAQDIALARLEPSNRVEPKDPVPIHSLTSTFLPVSRSISDSPASFFRWVFDKSNGRTLSPFSRVTVSEYIQSRIKDGTESSLKEAELLAQGDATLLTQIARSKKDAAP